MNSMMLVIGLFMSHLFPRLVFTKRPIGQK